jgi:hypothetical protein
VTNHHHSRRLNTIGVRKSRKKASINKFEKVTKKFESARHSDSHLQSQLLRRITIGSQPGQKVHKTPSQQTSQVWLFTHVVPDAWEA